MTEWLNEWWPKLLGSIIGVLTSMVMVRPRSTANALYRGALGIVAGVVFSPSMQRSVPVLFGGDGVEYTIAAACATGFTVWFILEAVARFLSREETMRRLLEEMTRLNKGD